MTRRALTTEDRIRGVRAAINSPRTPARLRRPLQQQLTILKQRLKHERGGTKRGKQPRQQRIGLLDWLGI